ncbi:hypothetical protein TNCV_2942911 [Trichonephila clavipes]|nr:hypothetical protein TNCV_2942911 [Trichonephila clavipes]
MVELVKGISKLPDRRLEADRPRHSIQFINDDDDDDSHLTLNTNTKSCLPIGQAISHPEAPIGQRNLSVM